MHRSIRLACRAALAAALILAPAATPARQVAPSIPIPQPGEISGNVSDAETGAPVVGAFVFIFHPFLDHLEPFIWDRTDHYGNYMLHAVPPGTHVVHVRHAEYEPDSKSVVVHSGLVAICNFALEPRPPAPPGAIAGRVTDAATGDPIAGAVIEIEGIYTIAPILTDENGAYAVDGIPPGPRGVRAFKEGYFPARQLVEVESGETSRADFALWPIPPVDPGAIAGQVTDGMTGEGIAGARVFYRRLGPLPIATTDPALALPASLDPIDDAEWPHVETDDEGRYRIGELRPGVYALRARAEGYFGQWRRVLVFPGQTTIADFALRPILPGEPGHVAGKVTNAETGDLIAGAFIFFAHVDEDPALEWIEIVDLARPHVRTDENGEYITPRLRPGKYRLLARARGFEPARAEAEVVSGEITIVDFKLKPFDPPAPGAIAGRVTDARSGEPIGGARVFYAPALTNADPAWSHLLDPALAAIPSVETGDDGFYRIPGLRPGRYFLFAVKHGYHGERAHALVESGATTRVDFALRPIVDPLPGAIAGRVTDAEMNSPIPRAFVFYAPLDGEPAPADPALLDPALLMELATTDNPPALTRTDAEGNYLIRNLRPGRYVVIAWVPGFTPSHKVVGVEPGAVSRADFKLSPLGAPDPGAIAGRVVDRETGEPIDGAWVFYGPILFEGALPDWIDAIAPTLPHVRTNEDGYYRIEPLRPGRYHLAVRAEGYFPAHKRVEVESDKTTEANFALAPYEPPLPGSIAGVVTSGATGEPIAGARVYYAPLYGDNLAPHWWRDDAAILPPHVVTDDGGRYLIDNLRPGDYYLLVRAEGFHPAFRRVPVEPGERTIADFKLEPTDPPAPGAIQGRVTDRATGEPIEGARVYYRRLPDHHLELSLVADAERIAALDSAAVDPIHPPFVETDADGAYWIGELRPGRYQLLVAAEGYMPQGRIVGVVSGGVTIADFALAPRGPATGSIFGRVVDAPTLEPIAEALILVVGEGDTSLLQNVAPIVVLGRARTDADGRYRIHELPAGRVRVYALKRGYRIAGRGVEIPPGGAVEVNFRLQPVPMPMTGHLVGRVRDARTEAPIARAYVAILPDQASAFALSLAPGQPRFTLTDRNGHYAFRDVPIGHYRVVAIKRGYEAGVQRVTIEKGAIARAHFLLEPITNPHFGSLHGRATDAATGAPLPGVWVRVAGHDYEWLNDPDRFSTRTDENGEFLFEHLREGTYEVHFAKRGYEPARERVEIVAGMRTEIEVALKPIPHFGALEGHVTDALTGDPIPGAYVFIPLVDLPYSANPDNTIFTRTDDDGYYRIDDAPPGLQVVVAWHPGYFPDAQLATIVAGETTTLDFALIAWPPSPGGSVTVRAIDPATGRPIAGARVHLSTNDWIQPFSEWDVDWLATDDNGYATFASPPPGDWALIVSIEGYQPEMALTSEAVFGDFGPEIAGAVLLEMVKGESSAAARGLWIIYPQPPF